MLSIILIAQDEADDSRPSSSKVALDGSMASSYPWSVCSTALGERAVHITVQLHVTEHMAAGCLMTYSRRARHLDVLDGSASESTLQTALCDGEPSNTKFGCTR